VWLVSAALLLLIVGAPVETATTTLQRWVDDAVAGRAGLPALVEVQAAAEASLHLADDATVAGWDRNANLRALLPRLDVRFGSQRDVLVRDTLEGLDWARTGQGLGVDVAARWSLGDLLLSDAELGIHKARLARAAAVRLARERVTQVYFQRVEVMVRLRLAPDLELVLEAARLDGLLDALTGGRLGAQERER
jgi:hypothetical protein